MATVYLAEVLEDRPYAERGTLIAVKMLHKHLSNDANTVERFRREGLLGLALNHPAVVRTFDIETTETDSGPDHFLLLEYVQGKTLRKIMAEMKRIPEALVRLLGVQIARGLQAIHDLGAVHRDLKPENILITSDYQLKLMDLGIARMSGATTLTSAFLGSIAYAAPEQFEDADVGVAADMYSTGVILYEAMTGKLPFRIRNFQDALRAHQKLPARVRKLQPETTRFLEEVIHAQLSRDPAKRFSSGGELASILEMGEASEWWRGRESASQGIRSKTSILRRIGVPALTDVVGRESELHELQSLYHEAGRGSGAFILITGEAGLGKTRLLNEFLKRLKTDREDFDLWYARHQPGGSNSQSALAQAVVDYFGPARLEAGVSRHLKVAYRLVPAFLRYLTGLPAEPGSEPLSYEAVHSLFCELLQSLSQTRPVVCVVEDLHYSSGDMRALLQSLARTVIGSRILLIATTRGPMTAADLAEFEKLRILKRLSLERLSAEESTRLFQALLGRDSLRESFQRYLIRRSDGNPFFMLELVQELKNLAASSAGSTPAEMSAFKMPASIRELLLSRLEHLTTEDRRILDAAAIQGFEFDSELISEVLERNRLEVLQRLVEIERQMGLVRAAGTGFQFDHHQLQELLYDAMPAALCREYHARSASCYEARMARLGRTLDKARGIELFFLATHYLKGGTTTEGLKVLLPALDYLAMQYENEALLELAELAISKIEKGDYGMLCDVKLRVGDCYVRLGMHKNQRSSVMEAITAADRAQDAGRAASARCALGVAYVHTCDYPAAQKSLNEALLLAQKAGDRRTEAEIFGHLAQLLVRRGHFPDAPELYERELQLSREISDKRGEASALARLGTALIASGDILQGRTILGEHLSLAGQIGYRQTHVIYSLGLAAFYSGDYRLARRHYEQQVEESRAISYRYGEMVGMLGLGWVSSEEGRLGDARDVLNRCLALCRALDGNHYKSFVQLAIGNVSRSRGAVSTAEQFYREALDLLRDMGAGHGVAEASFLLGRLLLEQGENKEAKLFLNESYRLATEIPLSVRPGPLPAAYLALLQELSPESVHITESNSCNTRAETELVLFLTTRDSVHLTRAEEMLKQMSRHLDAEGQANFWRHGSLAGIFKRAQSEKRQLEASNRL